ncbi:MAG: right-handed parallel beta-helix repeat-containing protein, partial [bacterium]
VFPDGVDNLTGHGRINAYEALKYTLENYGGTLRGEVVFTEDMNFTNGVTLTIEPGTTIKLDPGVDLWFRDNSKLIAVGTSSEPITFTSTQSNPQPSSYGTIYLFGSNNQLEYCTVEYADWGVKIHGYPSATSGNVVKNCTFRYNDQGLRLHNSTVTVENTTLENNRHAYVILDNADVTISKLS